MASDQRIEFEESIIEFCECKAEEQGLPSANTASRAEALIAGLALDADP
jgi:hypothetical protein